MKTQLVIAIFLIHIIAGMEVVLCSYDSPDPPEHNIVKPWERYSPTSPTYNKKSIGDIIREALRKRRRNPIPPVIEDKIKPPIEYYLDPPKFLERDKSRLA